MALSKLAVVFGASGTVGSAAARLFAEAGYRVAAPVRNPAKVPSFVTAGAAGAHVHLFAADVSTKAGAQKALDHVNATFGKGTINTVVSSFGGLRAYGAPIATLEDKDFDEIVELNRPHFSTWATFGRQLLEENRPGTSYVFITGGAGETGGLGLTGIGAGIQISVARTALTDAKNAGSNLKVNELIIFMMIAPDEDHAAAVAAGKAAPWQTNASTIAANITALSESTKRFETVRLTSVAAVPTLTAELKALKDA